METFNYQFEKTEDYNISLELCCDKVFVHCTVSNISLSTMKKIKSTVHNLKKWCESMGYDELWSYAEDPSFMISMSKDVEYVGPIEYQQKTYEVFKWPKVQR